ncbi:SixA phosphatase family protein [Cochlodiniinecator piscidefendens]|uniref:SixA phosphatase family protein n=1 Tax=Cochlodiniinecator piscidefendens TaxID=2715756 RepID=UPI001408E619|nr:histidine phosphatase family protein [Cochlodiniinecator piscidefendens]
MTLRLILTRHAKSDWDDPFASDHERVLNERGRLAAPKVGEWLKENGYVPDEVFCSDAARTRETWKRLSSTFSSAPEPSFTRRLYLAPDFAMFDLLKAATGKTVMVVAHNPGIAELADLITITPPQHSQFGRYPTCATMVAEFSVDNWTDIKPKSARVLDFVVPRDF